MIYHVVSENGCVYRINTVVLGSLKYDEDFVVRHHDNIQLIEVRHKQVEAKSKWINIQGLVDAQVGHLPTL